MTSLLYCSSCKIYTLNKKCDKCKNKSVSKYPPRFSPQDNYGKYRRELKKSSKKEMI